MKNQINICAYALAMSVTMFATESFSQTNATDEAVLQSFWRPETAGKSELGQKILQLHSSAMTGTKSKDTAERESRIKDALTTVKHKTSDVFYNRATCAGDICEAVSLFPADIVSSEDDFRAIANSITDAVNSLEGGNPHNPSIIVNGPNERKVFGIVRYIKY